MREKLQKFGGAMFAPVMLFSFSGILLAFTLIFQNPLIMGDIAESSTLWTKFWVVIAAGLWMFYQQIELLFVIALPIGLVKQGAQKVSLEAFCIYMSFNCFISALLANFGTFFGVDFSQPAVSGSGLKEIAGVKTLDTGILGSIVVAVLVVWLHNKLSAKKVPEWLGMFSGSSFVVSTGLLGALFLAMAFCLIWPLFQNGISVLQQLFVNSGAIGIFGYSFLERMLLPTGLHHLLTQPFSYGSVVVDGGITPYWLEHLAAFSQSGEPLAELFPAGGFKLYGQSKIFGAPAIAYAIYRTAAPDKRKKVATLMITAALTAFVAGITEPLEFTFLFVEPFLYVIYAFLSASLTACVYLAGLRGDFTSGIISWLAKNWLPLWQNHGQEYFVQIVIGLFFSLIFYFVFKTLIIRFDIATPGRSGSQVKLINKKEYQQLREPNSLAEAILIGLGGTENIETLTNCATRLRVAVKQQEQVADSEYFKQLGLYGKIAKKKQIQVVVGSQVSQIRDEIEQLLQNDDD